MRLQEKACSALPGSARRSQVQQTIRNDHEDEIGTVQESTDNPTPQETAPTQPTPLPDGKETQGDTICPRTLAWPLDSSQEDNDQARAPSPGPAVPSPGSPPHTTWLLIHHQASRTPLIGTKVQRSDLQ